MTQQTICSGRYEIIRELGSGGFGVTYLVRDRFMPALPTRVAKKLKPIEAETAIYQLVQERFAREAALLEELGSHGQIPTLYAYFEEDNQFFLVQEYIQGQTLAELCQSAGVQPSERVRKILIDILEILEFIESKQIIHRDIKPENIILRARDGRATLIDFGAVREIMGTQITQGGATPQSSIIIGTPGFMPPEQASGRPVFSSDLYSLSLTMIYLLTGVMPQNLENDLWTGEMSWPSAAIADKHLVAVLNSAIKPNSRERFTTAAAMKTALNNGSASPSQQETELVPEIPETIVDTAIKDAPERSSSSRGDTPGNIADGPTEVTPDTVQQSSSESIGEEETFSTDTQATTARPAPAKVGGLKKALVRLALLFWAIGALVGGVAVIPSWFSPDGLNIPADDLNPPEPPPRIPATDGPNFGAIAYSASTGEYGYLIDVPTQVEAETGAVEDCESFSEAGDCSALVWFRDGCGALATGSNGYGSGWGEDLAAAENAALASCGEFGDACAIVDSVCTQQ